jgi:hypothetical protein
VEQDELRAARLSAATFNAEPDWRAHVAHAELVGEEEINGKACYKLVVTPKSRPPETRFYDKESNLLVKLETQQPPGCGPAVPLQMSFSDYRWVDGLLIAHRVETAIEACGTARGMIHEIEGIEHNVEIPADRFAVPQQVVDAIRSGTATRPRWQGADCPEGESGS